LRVRVRVRPPERVRAPLGVHALGVTAQSTHLVRGRVRVGDKVRVRVRVRVKVRVRLALSLNLTLTRTPSSHRVRVGLGRLHRAGQRQPRVAHCRGIPPRLEVDLGRFRVRVGVRVRVRIPPGLEVDLAASVQRGRVPGYG